MSSENIFVCFLGLGSSLLEYKKLFKFGNRKFCFLKYKELFKSGFFSFVELGNLLREILGSFLGFPFSEI